MTTRLIHEPNLTSKLKNKSLFLDTNVVIDASKYRVVLDFLFSLKEQDTDLLTIQSVFFEFMRGAQSLGAFKASVDLIQGLVGIWPIEKQKARLDGMEDFVVVMSRVNPGMSYADFLLGVCLRQFQGKAFLLTGNYKDFSTAVFNRTGVITFDSGESINNYGIYELSDEKYEKAAKNILETTKK